jgi:GNAT superfamily N-acetyltransferase
MHAEIKPATSRDAHILAELRYEFRSAITPARESASDFIARCERWMVERLRSNDRGSRDNNWRAWLALCEEVPCGTVWLHRFEKLPNPVAEREAHGYITSLFVKPDARGGGVGTALLGTALSTCQSLGIDSVILWPTPRSRSLYRRHGFARSDGVLLRVL